MDILLWILQIFLAAVFITLGLAKAVAPFSNLQKAMNWVNAFDSRKVRIIGVLETLGGFGLFFPGLYPINKLIIPISATGLAIIMIFAAITNLNLDEKNELISNIVLFLLAGFIVIGRLAFV